MKKLIFASVMVLILVGLCACGRKEGKDTITVGTISGPETKLMSVAKEVALKRFGLHVKIVSFTDYITPNQALAEGELDANAFQHVPYLRAQVKARGYKIGSIGKTFVYPMGLYSEKIKKLSRLKSGAKIAIPNDPSNEARALLLLAKAKLIKLKPGAGIFATPVDVIKNPKHLKFVELDAAELPRVLNDVAIAAINTNYAVPAGLRLSKNALFKEGPDSPYANIIAARCQQVNKNYECVDWSSNKKYKELKELVQAFQSKPVLQEAKKLFGNAAIPAWNTR